MKIIFCHLGNFLYASFAVTEKMFMQKSSKGKRKDGSYLILFIRSTQG